MQPGRRTGRRILLRARVLLRSIFSMKGAAASFADQVGSAPDLLIPERFLVVHKWFLETLLERVPSRIGAIGRTSESMLAGFIPLGLFLLFIFFFGTKDRRTQRWSPLR